MSSTPYCLFAVLQIDSTIFMWWAPRPSSFKVILLLSYIFEDCSDQDLIGAHTTCFPVCPTSLSYPPGSDTSCSVRPWRWLMILSICDGCRDLHRLQLARNWRWRPGELARRSFTVQPRSDSVSEAVMDIRYLLTRPMSQHMPVLGLLGLKGDLLVSSLTFSIFPTDTRIQ